MKPIPHGGAVAVLGAGVSGLSYAYFLTKLRPDICISIYDKSTRPGGWIHTHKLNTPTGPVLLEKGPRTLRGASDGTTVIVDMLRQLGAEDHIEVMKATADANRKYILDGNKIVELPSGIKTGLQFMKSSLSRGLGSSVLTEPFRHSKKDDSDETVLSFLTRRLGSNKVAINLASAMLHGIYAGNIGKLSVNSLMPRMVSLEKDYGSIVEGLWHKLRQQTEPELPPALKEYERIDSCDLLALKKSLKPYPMIKLQGGMQVFPDKIAQELQKHNVQFKYGQRIQNVSVGGGVNEKSYDHVHSTINTNTLSELVDDALVKKALGNVNYVSVFLVNVYVKQPVLIKLPGFGFLVPLLNTNPDKLLGVIYDSDTETHTKKLNGKLDNTGSSRDHHKITLMMGGHFYDEEVVPLKQRLQSVKNVLENYLHVNLADFDVVMRDEATESTHDIEVSDKTMVISYNLHEQCIPQYEVGYEEQKKKVELALESTNLSIGGMCYGNGVGVPDCVVNSLEQALRIK